MNATEQQSIADALERALRAAGIHVERADVVAGNVKTWIAVPAAGIIGRWLQNGWRVSLDEGRR